jgi:hypothetical protein
MTKHPADVVASTQTKRMMLETKQWLWKYSCIKTIWIHEFQVHHSCKTAPVFIIYGNLLEYKFNCILQPQVMTTQDGHI